MADAKGLELYLVRTIVSDFHGRILVEDPVHGDYKKGTSFMIMLPTVD